MDSYNDTNSKLYKTTFENGDVHYGRVISYKNYSPKTYLKDKLSAIKSNAKNPKRKNRTTEFELRVRDEFSTVKCEIIYEGLTLECCKKQDELIVKSSNCINKKNSSINKREEKPKTIKKEHVKKLTNPKTKESFFYVEWEWAKSNPYFSQHIDENTSHPLNRNFKKLTLSNIIVK